MYTQWVKLNKLLIVVLLTAVILFVPIPPFYQAGCPLIQRLDYNNKPLPSPPCTPSWHIGESLLQRIFIDMQPVSHTNPSTDETANWKIYTNDIFSFQYPNNWYVNKYQGSSNFAYFVQVSDVENSYTVIQGMSDTHIRIDIGNFASPIPSSFPYTNGSSTNNTIKPFSINSLQGIHGQQTSTVGLVDTILLQNPHGGYVELTATPPNKDDGTTEKVFNKIFSTFKFQ